jgi:hypothetical protein
MKNVNLQTCFTAGVDENIWTTRTLDVHHIIDMREHLMSLDLIAFFLEIRCDECTVTFGTSSLSFSLDFQRGVIPIYRLDFTYI